MANSKENNLSGPKDALLLTAYAFLLLAGYYQVKPLTRTLFLEEAGTSEIPYLWIGSAGFLLLIIPLLQWCSKKAGLLKVLRGTTLGFCFILLLFWTLYSKANLAYAVAFYIIVDVSIVILVENFWSAANCSFEVKESKKWYGLIGSGATLGAIAGSYLASSLLKHAEIRPIDLLLSGLVLLSCSLIIAGIAFTKASIAPRSLEQNKGRTLELAKKALASPSLRLAILVLFLMQLVGPLVEYLFLSKVEANIEHLKDRTIYLSIVFTLISSFGLTVNILLLPLLLKYLGLLRTLFIQPLIILSVSFWQISSSSLLSAASLKIFDRGLAYSIGRSGREILYVEKDEELIYFVKSWTDMFGYRLFKVIGAFAALITTSFLSTQLLAYCIVVLAVLWSMLLLINLIKRRTC